MTNIGESSTLQSDATHLTTLPVDQTTQLPSSECNTVDSGVGVQFDAGYYNLSSRESIPSHCRWSITRPRIHLVILICSFSLCIWFWYNFSPATRLCWSVVNVSEIVAFFRRERFFAPRDFSILRIAVMYWGGILYVFVYRNDRKIMVVIYHLLLWL